MVGTSKILTVSYGTFSCTLEGFDDPFSAMRTIAEYFRDLAAEDRFFGAEPPTPDAETLARLAQQGSNRRVTARLGDQSVALQESAAAPAEALPAQAEPAPLRPEAAAASSRAAAFAPAEARFDTAAHPAPAEASAWSAGAAAPAMDSDFAARMLRIRAAAARSVAGDADFEDQQSTPLGFAPIGAAFSDRPAAPRPSSPQPGSQNDIGVAAPAAAQGVEPQPRAPQMVPVPPAEQTGPDSGSPALDPAALRAAEVLDPLPVQRVQPGPVRLVRARVVKRRRAEALAEAQAGLQNRPASAPGPAAPQPRPPEPSLFAPAADIETLGGLDLGDEAARILAASEAAWAANNEHVDPADVVFGPADLAQPDLLASDASQPDVILPADPLPQAQPIKAADTQVDPAPLPAAPVVDDLEDDLARTLAAIRAEDHLYDPVPVEDAPARPDRLSFDDPQLPTGHAQSLAPLQLRGALRIPAAEDLGDQRRARLGGGDASVNRILKETNSQLDDSEASRRRSTIAHLKAAVAATRADQADGSPSEAEDESLGRYRDDLMRVVRQRRAEAGAAPRRLAPLMLISELRVDLPDAEAMQRPPLMASAGNLALADEDEDEIDDEASAATMVPATSFEAFAQQMGATQLPELLEAAAAYATYVEGRPHVSRPQLMHLAMTAEGQGASREDGLRAFGTLLRTGRIQKMKRGQFAIAGESRFRPA